MNQQLHITQDWQTPRQTRPVLWSRFFWSRFFASDSWKIFGAFTRGFNSLISSFRGPSSSLKPQFCCSVPGLGLTPDELCGESEELVNAIGNKTGHYKRKNIFTLSILPGDGITEGRNEAVKIQGNTVNETEDARQTCHCERQGNPSLFPRVTRAVIILLASLSALL